MDVLARLVEKSLLVPVGDTDGEPRLRMLETIRDYAADKFMLLDDRAATCERHATWILELLLTLNLAPGPTERRTALARFDADRANHREAVLRQLEAGNAAAVNLLIRAGLTFLSLRDSENEALQWLTAAIPAAAAASDGSHRQVLIAQAALYGSLGRYGEAAAALDGARALERATTEDIFDTALESAAEAIVATAVSPPREALTLALRAAEAMAAAGTSIGEAYMWHTATALALAHDPPNVGTYVANALRLADEVGNDGLRSQGHVLAGFAARRSGDTASAHSNFVTAANAALRSGQRSSITYALDGLAAACLDLGRPEVSARALAVSSAARTSLGRTAWVTFSPYLDELTDAARQALGAARFAAEQSAAVLGDVAAELERVLSGITGSGPDAVAVATP
jgi:hypothetical protein